MRSIRTAVALIAALAAPLAQVATVVYATGFEAPGYPAGPIGGGCSRVSHWVAANGWGAWPVEPYCAAPGRCSAVTNERAASDGQLLRLSIDPAANSSIGVWRSLYPGALDISTLRAEPFAFTLKLYLGQTVDSDVAAAEGPGSLSPWPDN